MAYFALPNENWSTICDRVANVSCHVVWRWAILREADDTWKFGALSVTAAAEAEPSQTLRYRTLVIGRETLPPQTAAERLRKGIAVEDVSASYVFGVPSWPLSPRHRGTGQAGPYKSRSGWPEYELAYDSQPATTGQQFNNIDQLVERGLPVYPGGLQAVAHLVFGLGPDERDLVRVGTVLIRLPDERARIADMRLVRGRLRVRVEGHTEGAELRLVWRSCNVSTEWGRHDWNGPSGWVVFPERGIPYELALYLVDGDGRVLDNRGWTGEHGDRPHVDRWEAQRVLETIRAGEDEEAEFKQEVDRPQTLQRLVSTVAAFANGTGGVVFIGVGDEGDIVGAAADIRGAVDNAIRNSVKPQPPYRWRALRLQGKPVQALVVDAELVGPIAHTRSFGSVCRPPRARPTATRSGRSQVMYPAPALPCSNSFSGSVQATSERAHPGAVPVVGRFLVRTGASEPLWLGLRA